MCSKCVKHWKALTHHTMTLSWRSFFDHVSSVLYSTPSRRQRVNNQRGDDTNNNQGPRCSEAPGIRYPAVPESRQRSEREEERVEKSLAAQSRRGEMRGAWRCSSPQVGLRALHTQLHWSQWAPVTTPRLVSLRPPPQPVDGNNEPMSRRECLPQVCVSVTAV